MTDDQLKEFARQLRKPADEEGVKKAVHMNETNRIMNLEAIKALRLDSDDRILEIGMGNGLFIKEIVSSDKSIRYTGCDFSETMIEEAKKINADFVKDGRVLFHLASADKLPLNDKSFNKIFTVNTIYFWEHPVNTLNELKRVLCPKGELTIAVRPKNIMENLPVTKYGFTLYSKEELEDFLCSNGFEIIGIQDITEPDREIAGGKIAQMGSLIISGRLI